MRPIYSAARFFALTIFMKAYFFKHIFLTNSDYSNEKNRIVSPE